jgi:hypothetical protein
MKSLLAAGLALAAALAVAPASADGSAPIPDGAVAKSAPGVLVLPPRTIYGRPNRPMVQIEIRPLSATSAAGAAHETLRTSLVNQSQPAPLH